MYKSVFLYVGPDCEVPCTNGGTCNSQGQCECPDPFAGGFCQNIGNNFHVLCIEFAYLISDPDTHVPSYIIILGYCNYLAFTLKITCGLLDLYKSFVQFSHLKNFILMDQLMRLYSFHPFIKRISHLLNISQKKFINAVHVFNSLK